MAHGAVIRDIQGGVIRIGCLGKVAGVTGVTGIGRVAKVAVNVALSAISNFVPFGQREKVMADITTAPIGRKHIVALQAVGRITGLLVVGLGSSLIILQMATDAVIADPVELQVLGGSMALLATYWLVDARERKPILDVQFRDIVDQPVGSRVATRTVGPDRLLVYIAVAGIAIGGCF